MISSKLVSLNSDEKVPSLLNGDPNPTLHRPIR